jgi:HD-GYP domain-containing protein (c-di-GMP phosphodiesterase class II)
VSDTRALLNRIAQFRRRLDALPRLTPGVQPAKQPPAAAGGPQPAEAESRTQAILESSLRGLAESASASPPALTDRARRLLIAARGLVARLKAMADDPVLCGLPAADRAADPLAVHYQEAAALTEAAVRYALTFPDAADEQSRLCEGLEGILDAARRRFDLLAGTLERRRAEAARIDALAGILVAVNEDGGPLDPAAVLGLADAILAEEPGRPLRFLAAEPASTRGYLGGPEFAAPARFVAAHSLNCASVLARLARNDPDWHGHARELVVAGLLHDVGMMRVDLGLLALPGPVDATGRRAIEGHAKAGAERILCRLPGLSGMAEVAGGHHERADGAGYPNGLTGDQVLPMARLVAAVDVYAAMCAPRPYRPAIDPRAALTDVLLLGERGRLDRYAAERLLALGLYPAGTVVELADGSTAVVLCPRDARTAIHAAARPPVAVLADRDGRPLASPRFVDLADAGACTVVRTLEPGDRLRILGRSYPEWA